MNKEEILIALEESLNRLHCGINAVELMMYGLSSVKNPSADGIFAIWNYLRDADLDVQKVVSNLKETEE